MPTIAPKLVMGGLFVLAASIVNATEFSVKIIDQNGNPISDAVVEIDAERASSRNDEIAVIDQINKRFVPKVIAIEQGQRVTFPNKDNIRHHVYSFSSIKQFSTELYADVPGEPTLFDKAGIATLGCNIHDSMVGYIFVSEWASVDVTKADGIVHFVPDTTPTFINVWHPWLSVIEKQHFVVTDLTPNQELVFELQINEPNQSFGFKALRE